MNMILFDMDGTLFDTEKHYQWAWRKAIADAGYELDASEVLKLRSLGAPYNVAKFQEWFGEDVDYHAIRQERINLMKENVCGKQKTIRGIKLQCKESGCRM